MASIDGFEFPTCPQSVAFTGQYVYGRPALGRALVGLPQIAQRLLRLVKGDAMLANHFWHLHDAGATESDWAQAMQGVLRTKPRCAPRYVLKVMTLRLEARAA